MKLSPSQKRVYDYLRANGGATYRELDTNLVMRQSSMRIAEMNHAYEKEHGEPLIITVRKQRNGEHVKGLRTQLTKEVSEVEVKDGVAVRTIRTVPL